MADLLLRADNGWWSGDGKELYYLTPDLKLMAVEVNGKGAELAVGASNPLLGGRAGHSYIGLDIPRDGKRILVAARQEDTSSPITLVTNWTPGPKR